MAKLLIIDDVSSTRRHLRDVLAAAGHAVNEAADGAQAIAMLEASPRIDAIILDLMMPNMNGWEFREYQLSRPALARIPTIVLTVRDLAEQDRYALRLGAATVLRKPIDEEALLDAVSAVKASKPDDE